MGADIDDDVVRVELQIFHTVFAGEIIYARSDPALVIAESPGVRNKNFLTVILIDNEIGTLGIYPTKRASARFSKI